MITPMARASAFDLVRNALNSPSMPVSLTPVAAGPAGVHGTAFAVRSSTQPAMHPEQLGDAPCLPGTAARLVRRLRLQQLGDGADPVRVEGAQGSGQRGPPPLPRHGTAPARPPTARAATSTPCPGGTRRRAWPAVPGTARGTRARTAPGSGGLPARRGAARRRRARGVRRLSSTSGWGSDNASSWFGRSERSSPPGPSTTSASQPTSGRQKRARNEDSARAAAASWSAASASAPPPASDAQRAARRSALTHSAWISTGLPCRGVIGRPSTLASIQVGWMSPSPARTSPSAASTPIPNRVPSR